MREYTGLEAISRASSINLHPQLSVGLSVLVSPTQVADTADYRVREKVTDKFKIESAREIARNKNSVLVIEEDYEIGTPEHCGGLVSTKGLEKLGIIPFSKTFDHLIESAKIHSPNGNSFSINSKKLSSGLISI